MSTQTGPCIKGREDAEIIRAFANEMKVMLPSAYTGATCSVLFADLKPGEGAPPHVHREYDEYFLVIAGTVSLVIDGKERTIVPDNLVFTPHGAVHSFKKIGTSPAKLLEWTIPGGNEPCFRAVGKTEANAGFDPKRLIEIHEQFGPSSSTSWRGEPRMAASGQRLILDGRAK